MKYLATALVGLTLLLAACTGGSMTPAQSNFLRDAAVNRIAAFNQAGVQLVELSPVQLLALDTACFTATAIAVFRDDSVDGSEMVLPQQITDICTVIMAFAAGDPVTLEPSNPEASKAAWDALIEEKVIEVEDEPCVQVGGNPNTPDPCKPKRGIVLHGAP